MQGENGAAARQEVNAFSLLCGRTISIRGAAMNAAPLIMTPKFWIGGLDGVNYTAGRTILIQSQDKEST
jgi:hypothetical protein